MLGEHFRKFPTPGSSMVWSGLFGSGGAGFDPPRVFWGGLLFFLVFCRDSRCNWAAAGSPKAGWSWGCPRVVGIGFLHSESFWGAGLRLVGDVILGVFDNPEYSDSISSVLSELDSARLARSGVLYAKLAYGIALGIERERALIHHFPPRRAVGTPNSEGLTHRPWAMWGRTCDWAARPTPPESA